MPLYPDSPNPASYAAPLLNFGPLGELGNDFYQGAENKRKYDVSRTFQGGLPRDQAGNIDFNRAAEMLATRGDASQLVPLANVDLQRKFLGSALSDSNAAFPTGPTPGPQSAAPQASPDQGEPRGVRNSNFGNIKDGSFARGQPGYVGSDGTFAKFETPEHGIQAATTLLGRYGQAGINTVQGVVNRWAPAGDGNNVTAYVASVSKSLGVAPDAPLDLSKPEVSRALAQAMFAVENGNSGGQAGAATAFAPPERPVIPAHGVPQGDPSGKSPVMGPNGPATPDAQGVYGADAVMTPQAPVRVAGPAMAAGPPSGAPGPAAAQPPAAPAAQPQQAPATGQMPAALRPLIPAQFNDPMQYVNFLRQKQAAYEAAGLTGIKGADGAAKAYGAQADKIMDAIGKFYELTPDQKNAMASGGLNPLQFEGQKQEGRVAAENKLLTPQQKIAAADRKTGESIAEYEARSAGDKKYSEDEAARFGKKYDSITKAGAESVAELPKLALAKQIMASPDFYSGPVEGLNLAYKRILATVDPSQANAAAPQEEFRKIISDSVRSQIRSLAESGVGRISIPEVRIIEKAAANQENTPAANRLLVELSSRMHDQSLGLDELARNYKGGRLDPGFDTVARDWAKSHPILTPKELQDPRLIAPPIYKSPEAVRAAGLAKGAPFQTPDGRIKYVP